MPIDLSNFAKPDGNESVAATPWLTLPSGWDTAWKAAKAARTGHLMVIGDSLAAGRKATDALSQSYFGLLRSSLVNAGLPLAGDYYPAAEYVVNQSPDSSALGTTATPWGNTQGATTCTIFEGGFQRCLSLGGTSIMPMVSFTTPYNATAVDLIYVDYASGTWQYNVDGGSNVTVTTTNPGTAAGAVVKRVQITGLAANTTHVINIGTTSGTNVLVLVGAMAYTGNTGLLFSRHVQGGISARAMATPASSSPATGIPNTGTTFVASFPPDKIGCLGAQSTSINFTGGPTQPDAAIIELGVNDSNGRFNVSSYKQALQRMVLSLRAGKANCSICMLIPCWPNTLYSDVTYGSTINGLFWGEYKTAIYELAQAFQCSVVDIDLRWGNTPGAAGFLTNTDIHPTTAGHADIASVLEAIF